MNFANKLNKLRGTFFPVNLQTKMLLDWHLHFFCFVRPWATDLAMPGLLTHGKQDNHVLINCEVCDHLSHSNRETVFMWLCEASTSFVHTAWLFSSAGIYCSNFKVILFYFEDSKPQWSLSWQVKLKYSNRILNIFEVYAQLDIILVSFLV